MCDFEKQRVLIVDDERINLNLLVDLLKSEYKTIVAKNGDQALKRAISDPPPDLILLDIMMPNMDGYEVCNRLKQEEKTKDIPVIFITAMKGTEDETLGFALGAVDYITKPLKESIVKARVKTHLKMKRQADILKRLACLDSLTEIPNRRRFDEVIGIEWNRIRRAGIPISVIFIDIDHFKAFNDSFGHGCGDDCLRRVVQALSASLRRSSDFIARYGGEEFVAVLPGADFNSALSVASAMRKNVEDLRISHSETAPFDYVTVSIGGSTVVPDATVTPSSLVKTADDMLYRAKQNGRNQVLINELQKNIDLYPGELP